MCVRVCTRALARRSQSQKANNGYPGNVVLILALTNIDPMLLLSNTHARTPTHTNSHPLTRTHTKHCLKTTPLYHAHTHTQQHTPERAKAHTRTRARAHKRWSKTTPLKHGAVPVRHATLTHNTRRKTHNTRRETAGCVCTAWVGGWVVHWRVVSGWVNCRWLVREWMVRGWVVRWRVVRGCIAARVQKGDTTTHTHKHACMHTRTHERTHRPISLP